MDLQLLFGFINYQYPLNEAFIEPLTVPDTLSILVLLRRRLLSFCGISLIEPVLLIVEIPTLAAEPSLTATVPNPIFVLRPRDHLLLSLLTQSERQQ